MSAASRAPAPRGWFDFRAAPLARVSRRWLTSRTRGKAYSTAVHAEGGTFHLHCRPPDLRAALWQRLAGEAACLIRCTCCPAPRCGRWFLAGDSRSDRQFCSAP